MLSQAQGTAVVEVVVITVVVVTTSVVVVWIVVVGVSVVLVVGIVVLLVVVVPHTFVSETPQVAGAVQLPHCTVSPQSSVNDPQSKPSVAHVLVGVQPH